MLCLRVRQLFVETIHSQIDLIGELCIIHRCFRLIVWIVAYWRERHIHRLLILWPRVAVVISIGYVRPSVLMVHRWRFSSGVDRVRSKAFGRRWILFVHQRTRVGREERGHRIGT